MKTADELKLDLILPTADERHDGRTTRWVPAIRAGNGKGKLLWEGTPRPSKRLARRAAAIAFIDPHGPEADAIAQAISDHSEGRQKLRHAPMVAA